MKRETVIGAVIALLGALTVIVWPNGGSGHRLLVTVPEATNVLAGQEVRVAGHRVGEVRAIMPAAKGARAQLELALDDVAWPVRRGAHLRLRWGGTISYDNRYLALRPGPEDAPPVQALGPSDFTAPVEFDQLIGTFDRTTRRHTRSMLKRGGAAMRAAEPALRRTLGIAPPSVAETADVLEEFNDEGSALSTLVDSSARVTAAIDRAAPGIAQLVSNAAQTLRATGEEASSLQETLDRMPATLTTMRTTLRVADGSLARVATLAHRLAPGVRVARHLGQPLASALATLAAVGPDARAALATTRRGAPDLTRLLAQLTTTAPQLGSIAKQAATALRCVRPYAPEIAAYFGTWGDFTSPVDGKDHYGRTNPEVLVPALTNAESATPGQAAANFPGLRYAFPRPPGENAGQPWFLPECGITEKALDPAQDPEARAKGGGR